LSGPGGSQRDVIYDRPIVPSTLVYKPKCGGEGGSCGVSANKYSCADGAQINFGDLTPYLTYGQDGADLSADNSEEVLNEFKFLTQSEVHFPFKNIFTSAIPGFYSV
jgi:hypothetical protein